MKKTVILFTVLLYVIPQAAAQSKFNDARDGKSYQTVEIGDQIWMQENLAFAPENGNYWAYNDEVENVETYGYLYDYETAVKVCPPGWRLPSLEDLRALVDYVTSDGTDIHNALKKGGSSGFEALPGGFRRSGGSFHNIGETGYWITSSTCDSDYHVYHLMVSKALPYLTAVNSDNIYKNDGLSVRCIKEM